MAHLRDVHRHLGEAAAAHAESHQEALRQAAVARAALDAQPAPDGQPEPSEGDVA